MEVGGWERMYREMGKIGSQFVFEFRSWNGVIIYLKPLNSQPPKYPNYPWLCWTFKIIVQHDLKLKTPCNFTPHFTSREVLNDSWWLVLEFVEVAPSMWHLKYFLYTLHESLPLFVNMHYGPSGGSWFFGQYLPQNHAFSKLLRQYHGQPNPSFKCTTRLEVTHGALDSS